MSTKCLRQLASCSGVNTGVLGAMYSDGLADRIWEEAPDVHVQELCVATDLQMEYWMRPRMSVLAYWELCIAAGLQMEYGKWVWNAQTLPFTRSKASGNMTENQRVPEIRKTIFHLISCFSYSICWPVRKGRHVRAEFRGRSTRQRDEAPGTL